MTDLADMQDEFIPVDTRMVTPDNRPTGLALQLNEEANKDLNQARMEAVADTVTNNPTVAKIDKAIAPLWGDGAATALMTSGAVVADTVARGLNVSNSLFGLVTSQAINAMGDEDPTFDPMKKLPEVSDLPYSYRMRLMGAESDVTFRAMEEQMRGVENDKRVLEGAGASGVAASMAAGIVDVDALLIPLGGSVLGQLAAKGVAKVGMAGTRAGGLITGAVAGAETGLLVGGANAALNNTGDASDIPSMLLSNMALGGVIGGASKLDYDMLSKSKEAHDEYIKSTSIDGYTYEMGKDTAGAMRVVRVPTYRANLREGYLGRFDKANQDPNAVRTFEAYKTGVSDISNPDSPAARVADKLQYGIDRTPMRSLFSDLSSNGLIGSQVAHDILVHPAGLVVNTQSGAIFKDVYHGEILEPMAGYRDAALAAANKANATGLDKAKNMFVTQEAFKKVNREVMIEMEHRWHDDATPSGVSQQAMEIADMWDNSSKRAMDILKGRTGETPVFGSEELQWKRGYIPRKWLGDKIKEHGNIKEIEAALMAGYKAVYTNLGVPDDAIKRYVGMIINRSQAVADGIDTNLVGLLRTEGKEYLRDTLTTNGMSKADQDSFINALTGASAERAKLGNLKDRIDLDMRIPVGTSGKQLIDFIDQDVHRLSQQYAHRVSGTSALARKGIQRGDLVDIEEAIVDEARAMGRKDIERVRDVVKTAMSYYGAGPVGKGLTPEMMSMMRLTRMSMLGTAGLTQMGELGSIIAANGWEAVSRHMIPELKAVVNGTDTLTSKELHDAFLTLGKDHIIFNQQMALDAANNNPYIQHEMMDMIHKTVQYGERIHGYTSLMNHAMAYSQRLAVASTQSKIYNILSKSGLDEAGYRRMLDLGLDTDLVDYIQAKIKSGKIVDTPEGVQMNFKDWDAKSLQDYKLAVHSFTARMVQKQLAGESSYWMTTPMGRILGQFRTFPLVAMQKQFLRNMKHADPEAVAAVAYTLMTGGVAYATGQAIKGNTQNLTPERIAKGAINYSSQVGWMPMAVDPMLAIMGLDDYQFNGYNPYGSMSQGVIPLPPVFPTANKLVRLPVALLGSVNGVSPQEAQILSATPIVGSMYGFGAYFNSMKHD